MNKFKFLHLTILLSVLIFGRLQAQLSGTYSVPLTYTSIAAVITDLNIQGVNGPVTILVDAGYTEVAPVGGYSLYATGTSTNPITFQKNGSGTNPLITAYSGGTATPASAVQDGIWRFIGCDYITIDGIDLIDPNTSNPSTMEFGYGFFKSNITNGCRYNVVKNCVITLNRINGANSTFPASEGSRGIDVVNATTGAHTTPLSITTALGANSYNTFHNNLIQNCHVGIALIGFNDASPFTFADQYNDIGGTSAATSNTIINFGGGPFTTQSSGIKTFSQYYINISYNIINNNNGAGSNHGAILRGINSQVATSANVTISNNTITIQGGGTVLDIKAIENYAGGTPSSNTVSIVSNLITNCSYSTATSGTFYGIHNNGNGNSALLSINNNTFINNSSRQSSSTYYSINNEAASPNVVISNNYATNISLTNSVSSAAFTFIQNSGSATGGTVSIHSNTLEAISFTVGSTGAFTGIHNNASGGNAGKNLITDNFFSNLTINSISHFYLINNSANVGNSFVNGNFANQCQKSGAGLIYTYYNSGGGLGTGTATISTNNFSNIVHNGSGTIYGIYHSTSSNQNAIISSNVISGLTAGTGSIIGIHLGASAISTVQSNSLTGYNGAGAIFGIQLASSSNTKTVCDNQIGSFSTSGASTVYGYFQNSGNVIHVYRNKIYDLQGNNPAVSISGLFVSAGIITNLYNNFIGELKAPAANNWNVINGINLNGGNTINVYYNTVRINASSTGFDFGTSAIYASISPTVNLRNNIFINTSTANGSAFTVAYRRSTIGLSTYSNTSNNNLFYAGTPSASNLIFSDATNFMQTLSAYQTFVSPRDAASATENTSFISTVGTSTNFLHVNPSPVSVAEGLAVNIAGITTDFDNEIRHGNPGYTGNGLAPDAGADEFESIYPNCTGVTGGTITPLTSSICAGQTASFTRIATPVIPGILNEWKVAATAGGPYTVISNANGLSYTTPTLSPGTYYYILETTCTLTSQSDVSNEATVTVHPYPSLAVAPGSVTLCSPGGSIALTASGASSYSWSPSTGLSSTTGTVVNASPASTTTYVVSGSGPGNCTSTINVVIAVVPGAGGLTVTASPTNICQGGGANLSAQATSGVYDVTPITFSPIPTPTSGVSTFCSNGTAISSLNSGNLDEGNWAIASLPFNFSFFATNYNSYAVSTNGFMALWPANNITSGYGQPFPSFTAGRPCIGAVYANLTFATTGTINTFVVGTSPNQKFVLNYLNGRFSPTNTGTVTTQIILYQSTNVIEVHTTLNTGQLVAVEGIQNVNATSAYVVPGRNAQTFTVTNDAYRFSPTITYTWFPLTYLGNANVSNPLANSMQSSTIYTVMAQSVNGCVRTGTVNINVNPSPTISISSSSTNICSGNSVTLAASGANTYTWNTSSQSPTITTTPAMTTTYIVNGTGTVNSCVGSAVKVITVSPTPTVSITGNSVICMGQTPTLTSTGANTYVWSNSATTSSISPTISATTSFSVTGTNTVGGCTGSAMQTVTVYPNPTVSIAGSTLICSSQNVTLSASGANTYSWSSGSSSPTIVTTPFTTTTYTVTGTQTAGSCTGTAVHTVSVNPSPTLAITGNTILCKGQTTTIQASGADTFSWSNGVNDASVSITPTVTSILNVTGTNTLNSCTTTSSVGVTVVPIPTLSISGPTAVCAGQNSTLTVSGASTYSWSTGSTSASIVITPTTATSFSVTGISGPGCSDSGTVLITVNPLPVITISANPTGSLCTGETATLTASGANTYLWNTSATSSVIVVSPIASTNYTVTGTDGNGCSQSGNIGLIVDPCTGVNETSAQEIVQIFPNPTTGKISVIIAKPENNSICKIYDSHGKEIIADKFNSKQNEVSLGGFPRGLYYIKIYSNEKIIRAQKIILE